MIQVAPNRSQNGLIALAVLGVVGVAFLATYKPLPAEPVSTAGPTQVADAVSPGPSPTRSFRPLPTPIVTPRPTPGRCVLPSSLPAGATSVTSPTVEGEVGSVLFASPTYGALPGATHPTALDDPRNYDMGLWYVPSAGAEPTLVTSAGPGMIIPLALSPSGNAGAVWWWPDRRIASALPCEQGIYAIDLPSGASRLIERGDWAVGEDVGATWEDETNLNDPARFLLPAASFAADGSALAVVERDRIDVYAMDAPEFPLHHVGACPAWGWAPAKARFVAGCEDMTTAWLVEPVCCDASLGARNLPIPSATLPEDYFEDWEQRSSRAIGFTADGDVRITRIYGFATGCEGPSECDIPPPAWAVTTIDTATRKAMHELHETDQLFDHGTRLSADASWLYGLPDDSETSALTVDLATRAVHTLLRFESFSGAALDGSAVFGWGTDESQRAVIRRVTRDSSTKVLTIGLPDGAASVHGSITIVGLWVGAAA